MARKLDRVLSSRSASGLVRRSQGHRKVSRLRPIESHSIVLGRRRGLEGGAVLPGFTLSIREWFGEAERTAPRWMTHATEDDSPCTQPVSWARRMNCSSARLRRASDPLSGLVARKPMSGPAPVIIPLPGLDRPLSALWLLRRSVSRWALTSLLALALADLALSRTADLDLPGFCGLRLGQGQRENAVLELGLGLV